MTSGTEIVIFGITADIAVRSGRICPDGSASAELPEIFIKVQSETPLDCRAHTLYSSRTTLCIDVCHSSAGYASFSARRYLQSFVPLWAANTLHFCGSGSRQDNLQSRARSGLHVQLSLCAVPGHK